MAHITFTNIDHILSHKTNLRNSLGVRSHKEIRSLTDEIEFEINKNKKSQIFETK